MPFETHIEGNRAVICFVNGTEAFRPLAELERVLSLGVKTITMDLRHVDFIDSTGLGELVASHARVEEASVHLSLVNVTPDVWRFLKLANVQELLDIQDPESPPAPTGGISTTMRVGTGHSSRVFEARLGEHEGRQTLILIMEGAEVPMSPGKAKLSRLEILEATDAEHQALRDAGYEGCLRFL